MGKIEGVMVMVNFFDHRPWGKFQGVMVMVSALPPPQIRLKNIYIQPVVPSLASLTKKSQEHKKNAVHEGPCAKYGKT